MRYFIIVLGFQICVFTSCSERQQAVNRIEEIELKLGEPFTGDEAVVTSASAIEAYSDFIAKHPKDTLSLTYKYKIIRLQFLYLHEYEKAKTGFEEFLQQHPGHYKHVECMMMIDSINSIREQMIKNVTQAETHLKSDSISNNFNEAKVKALIEAYQQFSNHFPADSLSPDYLFNLAIMYYRNLNIADKALQNFEKVYTNYPGYHKLSDCLFWIGYLYDNDFHNITKAEKYYKLYLEKFPEHELNKDVDFLLKHLGMTDEEILNELLQKGNDS